MLNTLIGIKTYRNIQILNFLIVFHYEEKDFLNFFVSKKLKYFLGGGGVITNEGNQVIFLKQTSD